MRKEIKDSERIIKDKEKQLENIKNKVNKRISVIQDREKELLDMRIANDIEYMVKLKEMNNIQKKELGYSDIADNNLDNNISLIGSTLFS